MSREAHDRIIQDSRPGIPEDSQIVGRQFRQEWAMRNGKHNSVVTVVVAAAALALGTISTAAYAQDSSSASANQRGSDAKIAARVKNALQSNATLDSRHIDVAVEHGEVHLKGF